MKISILTLFPEMFSGPFEYSIVKRAQKSGHVEINFINIRDYGIGSHKMVDDTPYGGGIGMVMRVDVLHKAILAAQKNAAVSRDKERIVLMTARGKSFKQQIARSYAGLEHLVLICGHYEGIDERISKYIDEELSIGDFVLTGGEIPAMLITDAVTRLLPGVLKQGATEHESFSLTDGENNLIEYPQYTKPPLYESQAVPDILLSGDHKKVADWRITEAIKKTSSQRPDMLK